MKIRLELMLKAWDDLKLHEVYQCGHGSRCSARRVDQIEFGHSFGTAEKQGRHRYFRLASPLVGQMLESVMAVAGPEPRRTAWRGGDALRTARTCYDHLAGRLGVALADSLFDGDYVALSHDGGEVTDRGHAFLCDFGAEPAAGKRVFCRPCLDWSERRPHIAGRLGAALASRCLELGWIARQRDSRAVTITAAGALGFAEQFGIQLAN